MKRQKEQNSSLLRQMQILFPLDELTDILTSDYDRSEKISLQIAASPNIKQCKMHEKYYTTNSHQFNNRYCHH